MTQKSTTIQIIIDPSRVQKEYFKDLLRFRELFFFLAWRDILVRYKQAFLGIAWAVVRPLLNMAIFAFVFGRVADLPSEGISYPLFVLGGLIPWQFFANGLMDGSHSLINNAPMISKIYFPRIILPISSIVANLVDFGISLAMMGALLLFFDLMSWRLLFLPLLIFLSLTLSLGVSLWSSAMMVQYRDLRFIIPFIMQFGLFISPVGYGSFIVPESNRFFYYLNPMAGLIDGFRWCFFGIGGSDLLLGLGLSVVVNMLLLILGFHFFRKVERFFADII